MSLVPDYEDSSNSSKDSSLSSHSDEKLSTDSNTDHQTKPLKLPTPTFLLSDNEKNLEATSSVFKNPYAEAENAKEAILQKHVKMVQNKNNITAINGKHICWNYRKMGRCRFGHNCKYAHDSDLQLNTCAISNGDGEVQQDHQSSETGKISKIVTENKEKRRKRPGLSDSVTPSKRVVKNYYKLKQ